MSEPKVETWTWIDKAAAQVAVEIGSIERSHVENKGIAAAIIARNAPKPNAETPHGLICRAYRLLLHEGRDDPALMEAASLLDDASRLINGKDEPQPIRRGDVVQFKPPHPRCGGFDVIEATDESGACEVWGYGKVAAADLIRIGRAKFMPDGTPVED